MTIPPDTDTARLIELSDERDLWARYADTVFRLGYLLGRSEAYDEGWAAAEDLNEREHQAVAARVLETDEQSVRRRLQAADAGGRRDAAEHWRRRWAELYALARDPAYAREAYMTDPLKRDYMQIMALLLRARRAAA